MIIHFIHNQKGADIGAFFSAQKYFAKIVKKLLTNTKNCDKVYTDQTERAPEGVG